MSGGRTPRADLSRVRTAPLAGRPCLSRREDFATVPAPGGDILDLLSSLPTMGTRANAAAALRATLAAVHRARETSRARVWALGPHVVKYGLGPLVVDLMARGFVSAVVTTGAGAVHDLEVALIGATSEEMAGEIGPGRFGMAEETGRVLTAAARRAVAEDAGLGETLGEMLGDAPHAELSILASARRLGLPATVHVALGTDINHMHPSMDGAAMGAASMTDFAILAGALETLEGGIHLNVASGVVLPEVFLKALTVVQNLRAGRGEAPLSAFTTVAIDHESRYRPLMNVVRRPTEGLGEGMELLGRVELMVPLLAHALATLDARG